MSDKTSTNRPKPLAEVDAQFDSLRAALTPMLSTLSAEQQAALSAVLDEEIDKTHQAVVAQVRELTEQPSEIFDRAVYRQKLKDLQALASNIKYIPARHLPRDTEWTRTLEFYKHKLGKFFKVAFIYADDQDTAQKWMQAILIQEFDQYDKHACDKITGDNVLPLRLHNGQLEAAITLRNPPGSFGQTIFVAPHCSNSNLRKPAFCGLPDPLWSRHQRTDSNRMTGKISNKVVFVDENLEKQIDSEKEKIIWFSVPELKHLIDEPQMEDSPTITLIQWILLNASRLQQEFQSSSIK